MSSWTTAPAYVEVSDDIPFDFNSSRHRATLNTFEKFTRKEEKKLL